MKHLSASEFVDLADGTLPAARAAHVAGCGPCREQAEMVRSALAAAREAGVPEPSPLFWERLSARVRNEIAETPASHAGGWRRPLPVLAWSIAAMLFAVLAVWQMPPRVQPAASPGTNAAVGVRADAADDPAWDLLVSVADDLKLEDAHAAGFSVRAATVDSAVQDLTPAEREELGRLLRDALKHSGA